MDSPHHEAFHRIAALLPRHLVKHLLREPGAGIFEPVRIRAASLVLRLPREVTGPGRQSLVGGIIETGLRPFDGSVVDVGPGHLHAVFQTRSPRHEGAESWDRAGVDLQFALQRAVSAAFASLDAARGVEGGDEVAAAVSGGDSLEVVCGGSERAVPVVLAASRGSSWELADNASAGGVLLDTGSFQALEGLVEGRPSEGGIAVEEWEPKIRPTPLPELNVGDYSARWMERVVIALRPLVPRALREPVFEGSKTTSVPLGGSLLRLEGSPAETPCEDSWLHLASWAATLVRTLDRGGEDVVYGSGRGEHIVLLAVVGTDESRVEEVLRRALESAAQGVAVRASRARGELRLVLEGGAGRLWPAVSPVPDFFPL